MPNINIFDLRYMAMEEFSPCCHVPQIVGFQMLSRRAVITLKPFEEGYALTNKKHYNKCTLPEICNYQALDGEHQFFYEPFSLKMYTRSAKTRFLYACMLCFHICFAFMFAHMYAFI